MTEAMHMLQNVEHLFDAVAFRGVSGALIAPLIAWELEKDIVAVRKPFHMEETHSWCRVEGGFDGMHYLIVDDLICNGNTVDAIVHAVTNRYPVSKCVAIYCYNYAGGHKDSFKTPHMEVSVPVWCGAVPVDPEPLDGECVLGPMMKAIEGRWVDGEETANRKIVKIVQ